MNQPSAWRLRLQLSLTVLLLSTCGGCFEYDHHGYYRYYLPTVLGVGLFFVLESVFLGIQGKRLPDGEGSFLPEKHAFAVAFPLIAGVLWFLSLLLGVPLDSFFFWYLFFLPALTVVGTCQYMGASETGVGVAFVVAPIAQYVAYGIVIVRIRWTRSPRTRARWLAGTALFLLASMLWFTIEPYPPEPDTTPGALGLPVIFAIHGLLIALLAWRAVVWWRRASTIKQTASPTGLRKQKRSEGNGGG